MRRKLFGKKILVAANKAFYRYDDDGGIELSYSDFGVPHSAWQQVLNKNKEKGLFFFCGEIIFANMNSSSGTYETHCLLVEIGATRRFRPT